METSMTLEMAEKRVRELEKQMLELMKRLDIKMEDTKKEKVKKEKVEKEEKTKKKKPMSGYLLYAKEMRGGVKEKLVENGNENPKPTEVITEVAKQWKLMSSDEQMVWNERAKTEVDDE